VRVVRFVSHFSPMHIKMELQLYAERGETHHEPHVPHGEFYAPRMPIDPLSEANDMLERIGKTTPSALVGERCGSSAGASALSALAEQKVDERK
jgi:hypothetical protein